MPLLFLAYCTEFSAPAARRPSYKFFRIVLELSRFPLLVRKKTKKQRVFTGIRTANSPSAGVMVSPVEPLVRSGLALQPRCSYYTRQCTNTFVAS